MAKKTQAQIDAEEALRLIEKEAQLRERMNSGYDEYIKAVKEAHAIQETLNRNVKIQEEVEKKLKAVKAGTLKLSAEELAAEVEKLKILKKQNDVLSKQADIYKSAAKEANVAAMSAGKAFKGVSDMIVGLPGKIQQAYGKIRGLGLFEFDKAIKMSALSMGVLSKESVGFRNGLKAAAKETTMIGVNLKGVAELQQAYSDNLGRSVVLSKEGLKGLAEMSQMTGLGAEGSAQMAADMDLQGYSAEKTAEFVNQTLDSSHKMGVNATKVMKNISTNFKMLNRYHFKQGAKGLAQMAELTTKLGVDMKSTSAFADKLWNVEGAVETSAQLNVMGGAWAQLGDTFHLMYMARNDMKGLTEEIAAAASESISFNNTSKEFEMTAEGMHKLKIIAEKTNLAYDDLVTMGMNLRKSQQFKTELGFTIGASDEDKQMLDYITSKSTLKDGQGEIVINGQPKLLKTLNEQDKQIIKSQMQEQQNMKQRAEDSKTFDEKLTYLVDQLKISLMPLIEKLSDPNNGLIKGINKFVEKLETEKWGQYIEQFAETVGGFVNSIGNFILENPKLSLTVLALSKAIPLISGAFSIIGGIWDTAKWVLNGIALSQGFNMGAGGLQQMIPQLASKFLGYALPAVGGVFAGWLGGKGYDAVVGEKKKTDTWSDNWGKKLGRIFTTTGVGAAAGAGIGSLGAGIGAVPGAIIGGIGGLGMGLYDEFISEPANDAIFNAPVKDAIFNSPVKDGFFNGNKNKKINNASFNTKNMVGTALNPSLGANMMLNDVLKTRGIVQNGKITPIDTRDDVLAIKRDGAINKYSNSVGGGGTTTMKHEFNELSINGTIKLEIQGNKSFDIDISKDEMLQRELRKSIQIQTIKQLNYGKLKGKAA